MPVSYRYNSKKRVVEIVCWGELKIDEIMGYFEDLRDDDSVPIGAVEIVDLSRIKYFNVDFREASAMPAGYTPAHEAKAIRATILFGMNPLNEGLAKLIEIHFHQTLPHHRFQLAKSEEHAYRIAAEVHAEHEKGAC